MKLTLFLLAFICALVYFKGVQGECCRTSLTMSYAVYGVTCDETGGRRGSKGCTITVCADGKPLVGTYCGRGSCNAFGCACKRDCITGKWKESFLDLHKSHEIVVIDETWN